MGVMIAAPSIPAFASDLTAAFGGLPLTFELSRVGLAIVMTLVLIFFAVASIVLIYHWRRFPFEQDVFDRVERLYEAVSVILVTIAVFGIFFS
jgi:membrane protein implicated in regulation of membrane protease activity